MSDQLRNRLYHELDSLVIVDSHTHIQPLQPTARSLWDILGYHYYTELAHAAGMPSSTILAADLTEAQRVRALVDFLPALENTIQYQWFSEIACSFFDFEDEKLTANNCEALAATVAARTARPDWARAVMESSGLSSVFLTNDFDDPLQGFDTELFVPCLRADELVFKLALPSVRQRLEQSCGRSVATLADLGAALTQVFERFVSQGARACAVSLPPAFVAHRVRQGDAVLACSRVLQMSGVADNDSQQMLAHWMVWTLAELCQVHGLPFCLMIGAERGVYRGGIPLGQDLFDSRVSLMQYAELFNAFPDVRFPVSLLASNGNQELAAFAWIFPNVICNGHWWYSGISPLIERDLAVRLECVPQNKQIGYYSDMFRLEFALPKFRMYKRCLARVLAERFVLERGWSEVRAFELGRTILKGNTEHLYGAPKNTAIAHKQRQHQTQFSPAAG